MKKLLCWLMALAACCMLATVASAEEATVPTTCAAGCENPTWEPLPAGNWNLLAEGHYHYYLTGDDTTYRYTPNPNKAVSSTNSAQKVTICLDLNGKNITTNGRALGVYSGCTLNIMDSSADQTGYVQGSTGSNNSAGGTSFLYGTLNMYSGALKFTTDSSGIGCGAGCVSAVYSGGVLNLYGGAIEGGDAVISTSTLTYNGYGGALILSGGKLNVYGGTITAGSVPEGGAGPCIYMPSSASSVTLSGDGDVADIFIANSSAKVNISGTYSGKARLTYADSISLSNAKVIGTATNTPNLTGDLFCTNGWLVNVSGSNLQLATYTPNGEWHYCEHCKEIRRWTAMTSSNYKIPKTTPGEYHYYLNETFTGSGGSYPQLCSGAQVCLDLYGKALTNTSGRALLANGGSILNLMDTQGNGYAAGGAGTNNPRGGTLTASPEAVFNMYSGKLKYTYADTGTNHAGGVVAVGGTMNLYGGTIEGTTLINGSGDYGAAIYLYKGTDATAAGTLNIFGGTVTSGTLPADGKGDCIYVASTGTLKLSGNANIANIYFAANEKLFTVSDTFSGTASVTFASAVELGTEVGVSDNAAITGKIACTNGKWLVTAQDEKLVISKDANVTIVTDSGEITFDSLQDAVDSNETGYIKLLHSVTEDVTVSEDLYLDLNGNTVTGTVTVTEGYTLYCKDSQTDDYTTEDAYGYGTLTVSGNAAAQEGYLKVTENGAVSFHKFVVEIHTMTLRPQKAGLYYKSTFLGDEQVAAAVQSFGVAMSVKEIPDATNMGGAAKYTTFDGFESGAEGNASTSTLLYGILKDGNSNEVNLRNMAMTVYGRAYLKTADGYIFGTTVSRSLTEQLEGADEQMSTLDGNQRNALVNMYGTFQEALSTLTLPNIAAAKTQADETLSIMMVGNSFCYYYVEELYGLLMANPNRTYDKVEIYNLYYSGCKLNQHYTWWQAGEAKYDLYKTDASGRVKQTPDTGTKWALEDALQLGYWDYLSLQGASSEMNYVSDSTTDICASIVKYAEPLLDRFYQLHPYAQLLWHRTWAFEVGRVTSSRTYDEESLAAYDAGMQAACDWMCSEFDKNKDYDLMMVNSGRAWAIAREENTKLETSLIPTEGGLCARNGVRNESTYPYYTDNANAGDGYHDGDIGGGQFLNACVWYETITGESVLDNTYKPTTYTMSDDFAALLRSAAHTALNPTEE